MTARDSTTEHYLPRDIIFDHILSGIATLTPVAGIAGPAAVVIEKSQEQ